MRIDKNVYDNFNKMLKKYVYIKECCAILNRDAEYDIKIDALELKEWADELLTIAHEYDIKLYKINDNYTDYDLEDYVIYLENKILYELRNKIDLIVQYPIIV